MCFCPVSDRAAIILSAELITLLVILSSSSLYPLFVSNLFSSHPPLQSGSPWIDINETPQEGARRRDGERRKKRERGGRGRSDGKKHRDRDRESEREKKAKVTKKEEEGGGKQKN